MNLKSVIFLLCALTVAAKAKDCPNVKRIQSKLICYYGKTDNVDSCYCTHVVLPVRTDVKVIEDLKGKLTGVKILLSVNEFNQGLVNIVKQNNIDGLELNLKNLKSKEDITDFIGTVRTKFGNDLYLALSIPSNTELLVKYYDFKALTKATDLFILQTAFLGASKNVTFHPSRLSGMWDMQNTDSVVDLVTGLGAPLSQLVVTAPVQAFQFQLQNSGLTTPGSPALQVKSITRGELCKQMNDDKEQSWVLERDQDQAGPYIFRGADWIAFEDPTSLDIKAKYIRVRGLAGLGLKDVSSDGGAGACGALLAAAHAGLARQSRAPRAALLRSLEREILNPAPGAGASLHSLHVSPFRITRLVDVDGHVHSVRKDTRTEFSCSREGYFVHPQSCGRFYRCVKFDRQSDEFSVFEFDCPAGLAFDERVEVCVWPGSLPHGAPCLGSSEIAPVPRARYQCSDKPGYYADPENCRWFFACLDHGQSEMTAYEFRCPFGLVFDEQHLLCQWPWLVPSCGNGHGTGLELDSIDYYGGAAKLDLVSGRHNLNVLDSYDGLGSLGTIALGGYQGDIHNLKNVLLSHGIGNINIHGGSEELGLGSVGLASGYDGAYLGDYGAQNGQFGLGDLRGQLSGSNLGLTANQEKIGEIRIGGSVEGAISGGLSGHSSSIQHDLTGSNINLGGSTAGEQGSFVNLDGASNFGSVEYQRTSGNSDFGHSLNLEGQLSGSNLGLTGNQETIGEIRIGESVEGAISGHSSSIQHDLTGSNINLGVATAGKQGSFVNLDGESNFGSVEYQGNSGYSDIGHNLNLEGQLSGSNLGLTGNQEKIGEISFGLSLDGGITGGQSGHSSAIQHDLTAGKQESFVNLNGASNVGSVEYQRNSGHGQRVTVLDSGVTSGESLISTGEYGKVASSSVEFNKHNTGGYETVSFDTGANIQGHLNTGAQSDTRYGTIQHFIPVQTEKLATIQTVPIQSTVKLGESYSGSLNYNNYQYGKKLTHIGDNVEKQQFIYAPKYLAVTPKTEIFNLKPVVWKTQAEDAKSYSHSSIHHYQSPVVQKVQPVVYEQKIQPILYEQKIEQPIVYEQKVQPIAYEQKTQPIVYKTESESAKSHSFTQIHHHQNEGMQLVQQPIVYEQKVQQPIVYEQKIQQPIVYEQKVQPIVYKTESESAKSHSFSQIHHHQNEGVQLVQQPIVYEQKVQPIVYEQKAQPIVYKTGSESAKSHSFSQIHHHQNEGVQLVQQPIVYEQKVQQPIVYEQKVQQPIVYEQKAQPIVYKTGSESAKSHSFSQIHHHQNEGVQLVQQPIVYEQKVQQPIVYEQKAQPIVYKTGSESAKSHSFSQIHHHQNEGVQLVQQPIVYEQKVQQPIVYEQKVQQPIVYEQNVQQPIVYEQKVQQPIVYEQKAQPIVYKTGSESAKSHSFSQIHHHQNEGVQLVQQPIVYEQKVQLPIVYEQKVQQPIVYEQNVQQPIVYEQKVQQPIVYEQKAQPIVYKTGSESAKSHSFSQIHHHQNEGVQLVQQPIVYEQKVQQPIVYEQKVQQPIVYEQKVQQPIVYEQKVQQPIVYEQKVQQPIVYEQKVQQPIVYEQKVQPIVYEQKVQPIAYEQKAQPSVFKTGSESAKFHSFSQIHHHQNEGVQLVQQPIVYEQKAQPIIYKTESESAKSNSFSQIHHHQNEGVQLVQQPIVYKQKIHEPIVYGQKVEPVQPVISNINHYITAPKIESIAVTPKYETQYYAQPAQSITYEAKVPVIEPLQVQKFIQPLYTQPAQPAKIATTYYGKQVDHVQVTAAPQIVKTYLPVQQEFRKYPSPNPTVHYVTPKPIVHTNFESYTPKPIVNTYYVSSTPKPKPVVYVSTTPKYSVFQEYVQPKQTFEIKKTIQPLTYQTLKVETPVKIATAAPTVVESYSYLPPKVEFKENRQYNYVSSTPKPKPVVYVSTTPKYSVFQEYVQPKQTFEIKKTIQPLTYQTYKVETPVKISTPAPTIFESYSYLPPKVEFKENRQYLPPVTATRKYLPTKLPEVYVSTTPKYDVFQEYVQPKQTYEIKKTSPTVITEYQFESNQPKVQTKTIQIPIVSTVKTVPLKTYQTDYILSTPKPTFVSTIAPVIKQTPTLRTKVVAINKFETEDNRYLVSTPKTIYISTPAPVITKTESPYGEFKYYDSRYDTATKKVEPIQYLKETSNEWNQFGSLDSYEYIDSTPEVKSTVRPVQRKKIVSTTTAIPLDTYQEYYDDKFDSQYIVSTKPTVTTTYRPTTIRPVQRKKIIKTTTALPLDIYDEKYDNDYIITTSRRPVIVKKKKIVTTTTALPVDYDEYYVSTAKPAVKITPRPKGKTIVRVNDFHPFLTRKLGAQCTCTSNTLKLRKSKQKEDIEEYDVELPDNVPVTKITSSGLASYDDYSEPGVYVVESSELLDYDYEPKKVVAVTKSPEYVIKSTTNAAQPAPTPVYALRKKVTSLRPDPKIILSSTPASEVIDEVFVRRSKAKEQRIAETVNEGLSLLKSAIKGYAKDAVQEEVRKFDRYGPGGWRSRDETLQGSVDCKRAGLFRHPTQCNKFYACHWDECKQRFTLAVFNCPVHLTFDTTQGACNWPSKGPACTDNTLLPSV